MWKSGTKVEQQEEDNAQNACKQLVVINLSGANRVFCRTDLILLIPCSRLCWMSLLNTLLISSLAHVWITYPDLQDLLISLGPWPKHNKKQLVWSGDLDRLCLSRALCSPGVVPSTGTTAEDITPLPRAQPQSHSASTIEGSLHRSVEIHLYSALCDDEACKFKSTLLRVKCFS